LNRFWGSTWVLATQLKSQIRMAIGPYPEKIGTMDRVKPYFHRFGHGFG